MAKNSMSSGKQGSLSKNKTPKSKKSFREHMQQIDFKKIFQKCDIDPVNVATGSQSMECMDLYMEDITSDFILIRNYESLYTKDKGILGRGWKYNIETCLAGEKDGIITVQMPDIHLERFRYCKETNTYENLREKDQCCTLKKIAEGYCLVDHNEKREYLYTEQGKLNILRDMQGNGINIQWEGENLKKIYLSSGMVLTAEMEGVHLKTLTDDMGRSIKYHYEGDFLTCITYANGGTIHYDYDSDGRILSVIDQKGRKIIENIYDHRGRVTRQVLVDGEEFIIYYNEKEKKNTFVTQSTGRQIHYYYNSNKLHIKTEYEDGTAEEVRHDKHENPIYEKDRMGNEIYRSYDERSRLIKTILPNGLETCYTYDDNDNLLTKTDNAGHEDKYQYIGKLLVSHTEKWGEHERRTENYRYDSLGRLIEYTDFLKNRTYYVYENRGKYPVKTIHPDGRVKVCEYDQAERLLKETTDAGTRYYGYNSSDMCTYVVDELGARELYRYDLLNNLTAYASVEETGKKEEEIIWTCYEYDHLDNIIAEIDPLGNKKKITRNSYGDIISETTAVSADKNKIYPWEGAATKYFYDKDGNCIKISNPDGSILYMEYDSNGNLTKKFNPIVGGSSELKDIGVSNIEHKSNLPCTCYTYDAMGRIMEIIDPEGEQVEGYEYDLAGNIIRQWSGTAWLEIEYNLTGQPLRKYEPVLEIEGGEILYRLTEYEYDKCERLITEKRYVDYQKKGHTEGRHNTITREYDSCGRLTKVCDSTGAESLYYYDKLGRLKDERHKISEGVYRRKVYFLDCLGRVERMKERVGEGNISETRYEYTLSGKVKKITTPEGHIILREYDACGRLSMEHHIGTDKTDITYRYIYDASGNVTEEIGPFGNTQHGYDSMGREVYITNPDGSQIIIKRNPDGSERELLTPDILAVEEIVRIPENSKRKGYTFIYDKAGRRIKILTPEEEVLEESSYQGNEIIVQKFFGEATKYQRDLEGKLLKVLTPEGRSEERSYDALNNPKTVTDGEGNTITLENDLWGRPKKVCLSDGSEEEYKYDHEGNIISAKDGRGNITKFEYGMWGITKRTMPDNISEYWEYDKEGRCIKYTNRNGAVLKYTYGIYGNLLSVRNPSSGEENLYHYSTNGLLVQAEGGGIRYDYKYDSYGRLIEKKARGKTLLQQGYDQAGRRLWLTDHTGKTTKYSYDLVGRLTKIQDNEVLLAEYSYNSNGTVRRKQIGDCLITEYSYDHDQNVIRQKTKMGNHLLLDNNYRYNCNGMCVEKQTLKGVHTYKYDSQNRLTMVESPIGKETYGYDSCGNRLWKEKVGKEKGTKHQYEYDSCNRLVKEIVKMISGRARAETVEEKEITTQYNYDKQGNLLNDGNYQYTYDGFNYMVKAEDVRGNIQKNRYDAEGLRYEMEENERLFYYVYDGREIITEETSKDTIRYIHNYEVISSDSEKARTYYHYASDELGSITHVVNEATRKIENVYEYDSFGNTICVEEAIHNPFRYAGQQYDQLTGLYYLRARFYNPATARFTQEDSYYGDGLNLYAYCSNNPVNYYDPEGHEKMCPKGYIKKLSKEQWKKIRSWTEKKNTRFRHYSYYTYNELKKLIKERGLSGKGIGFEAHHLLEKQFAKLFNVKKGDIISVALTPKWHRGVKGEKIIAEGVNIDNKIKKELVKIVGANNFRKAKKVATASQVWEAHKRVYESIGHMQYMSYT